MELYTAVTLNQVCCGVFSSCCSLLRLNFVFTVLVCYMVLYKCVSGLSSHLSIMQNINSASQKFICI